MNFEERIFQAEGTGFLELSIDAFLFQYQHNTLYRSYVNMMGVDPAAVRMLNQIPFLPVGFFKTHAVMTTVFEPECVFESSGTTHTGNSHHYLKSRHLYRRAFMEGFNNFYGDIRDYCILGLLPSYLECTQSSLVTMADTLIRESGHPQSGFYLNDYEKLHGTILSLEKQKQKTILLGVTFALLDMAERYQMNLHHTIVMETGGMKGRRAEITRSELHAILRNRWGLKKIHAEYGMTELLSQAYSKGAGIFECQPWMKLMIRNEDDPLDVHANGAGILNIIDLANRYSCSFIATDDVGRVYANGSFEVSGRVDGSDLRGCNLMLADDINGNE